MSDLILTQSASGPATTGSVTATLPGAPAAGNLLVLVAVSGAYRSADPPGWTLLQDARTYHGLAVWVRVATGGETMATYSINGSVNSLWWIGEFGVPALDPIDVSASSASPNSAAAWTTAAVTPSSGRRGLIAIVGGSGTGNLAVSTWGAGWTPLVDVRTNPTSGEQHSLGIAFQAVDGDGTTAFTATCQFLPAGSTAAKTSAVLSVREIWAYWSWLISTRIG